MFIIRICYCKNRVRNTSGTRGASRRYEGTVTDRDRTTDDTGGAERGARRRAACVTFTPRATCACTTTCAGYRLRAPHADGSWSAEAVSVVIIVIGAAAAAAAVENDEKRGTNFMRYIRNILLTDRFE